MFRFKCPCCGQGFQRIGFDSIPSTETCGVCGIRFVVDIEDDEVITKEIEEERSIEH